MSERTVVPSVSEVPEEKFHAAMMLGISRMIAKHGRDKVAHKLGVSTRQIGNLANGSFPAANRHWNLLSLDPTAMDEVSALYDAELRQKQTIAANDMETVADLSHLVGKWVEALSDGHRCHRETLELANVMRLLLHRLNAVCAEADVIRGVA